MINKRKKSGIKRRKTTSQIKKIKDKIINHGKISFLWAIMATSIPATAKMNKIRIGNFDYL
jgi:hypothetical protein